MKKIGVVTTSRADYGLYLPILKEVVNDKNLRLLLYVTGMHLSSGFGNTIEMIRKDGFPIAAKVPMLQSSDTALDIGVAMGKGTMGFAKVFAKFRPDILLVLGDRFEMHAAAVAAVPFRIPIAHIHGGEITYGAFDEYFRHSLTKMSHLHFVANTTYANRIKQMGEESWRITVSGSPALDNLYNAPRYSRAELERKFKIDISCPILLVTFHPVTLEYEKTKEYISNLLSALSHFKKHTIVFTSPNADTNSHIILQHIKSFVSKYANTFFIKNFGPHDYGGIMQHAAAMAGNSSSGIIEAASFRLPVVNIGSRQDGRLRNKNVIDAGYERGEIRRAVEKALSPSFKKNLMGIKNIYGDGTASIKIVSVLERANLKKLIKKRFCDLQNHRD